MMEMAKIPRWCTRSTGVYDIYTCKQPLAKKRQHAVRGNIAWLTSDAAEQSRAEQLAAVYRATRIESSDVALLHTSKYTVSAIPCLPAQLTLGGIRCSYMYSYNCAGTPACGSRLDWRHE